MERFCLFTTENPVSLPFIGNKKISKLWDKTEKKISFAINKSCTDLRKLC